MDILILHEMAIDDEPLGRAESDAAGMENDHSGSKRPDRMLEPSR
jgi:hypothetical protein